MNVRKHIVIDRDGVISHKRSGRAIESWEEFEFLPHALEGLQLLTDAGFELIVIANQACAADGRLGVNGVEALTRRMQTEVALSGGRIAATYYCRHGGKDRCECRMPKAGLLLRARLDCGFEPSRTFFIGASDVDLTAAVRLGHPAIRVKRTVFLDPDRPLGAGNVVSNLLEAAEFVLYRNARSLGAGRAPLPRAEQNC